MNVKSIATAAACHLVLAALLSLTLCAMLLLGAGQASAAATEDDRQIASAVKEPIYCMNQDAKSAFVWKMTKLEPGETRTVLDKEGEGVIERIWFSTDPVWRTNVKEQGLSANSLILKIFWDGSDTPAVDVPFHHFFNQPFGPQAVKNAVAQSDGDLLTFCVYLPMPFKESVRVEVHNSAKRVYRVWTEFCIVEKKLPPNTMYLHTQFNEVEDDDDNPIPVLREIQGRGRFLGTHISAVMPKPKKWKWDVRVLSFHVDQEPKLHYGSLTDFIGSAWWELEAHHDTFEFPYFGRHHVSDTKNDTELQVAMYRYFIQDALWFKKKICIDFKGRKKDECSWRILSYYYLDKL